MTQILKNKSDEPSQSDLVIKTIMSNIPALVRGNDYLAQDLIGPDVWATFSKGMRIGLGSVVYELVENKLLPLTFAGKTKSNKCRYRLN